LRPPTAAVCCGRLIAADRFAIFSPDVLFEVPMVDPPFVKPGLLYGLLAGSLLLNVVFLFGGGSSDESAVDGADQAATAGSASIEAKADQVAEKSDTAAADLAPAAVAQDNPSQADPTSWQTLRGTVDHSLARTFQHEAGDAGDALSGTFARLFVWDLNLRRDLQKGDTLGVVWRTKTDGLPEIAAASLHSQKRGALTAYRWKAQDDEFASFWRLDGTEVPHRLKDGPLADYEQITSLLKDRPSHKGMDFKTPVGTEVTTPRAGTVTRANWNWGSNGNCIEIRNDDGVLAKYLHLSANKVVEGARVTAGQVIALTGNTGHSTAPHLHYQLDKGDKTIDPLDYHGTLRRTLEPPQIVKLRADVAAFEEMLVTVAAH
jgi:murein DD-endopeptidase